MVIYLIALKGANSLTSLHKEEFFFDRNLAAQQCQALNRALGAERYEVISATCAVQPKLKDSEWVCY